jgi:hypothetical protein
MVQRNESEFWVEETNVTFKGAWWFPPNWITMPLAAYRRKLKEMQDLHYDE